MTPTTPAPATPWWHTLLITLANTALGFVVEHYLQSPAAGVGVMAAGTAVAHVLPSPRQR